MTKNKYIDIYNTVYGIDLVVTNRACSIEDLREKYISSGGEELVDYPMYMAVTCTVKNKETNRHAILVRDISDSVYTDADKRLDLINTAAHEALHVCMSLFDIIGEEVDPKKSNETFAYLLGWVTENIYRTWTRK